MMQSKFYVVWSPQGSAPTFRHPTKGAAGAEAVRLAGTNPGRDFYVLEAKSHHSTQTVVSTELK
jgi:hypothetical protein